MSLAALGLSVQPRIVAQCGSAWTAARSIVYMLTSVYLEAQLLNKDSVMLLPNSSWSACHWVVLAFDLCCYSSSQMGFPGSCLPCTCTHTCLYHASCLRLLFQAVIAVQIPHSKASLAQKLKRLTKTHFAALPAKLLNSWKLNTWKQSEVSV